MRLSRRTILIASSSIAFILLFALFWRFKAKVGVVLPIDLAPFSVEGYHKVLILAPHCDDESLGAAGIIQAARNSGIDVRVVIATNGDGYLFATLRDFRRFYPRPQDYIKMGILRQQESLRALRVLGLGPKKVIFLSYPDRGTSALWEKNWSAKSPYRSPYSGVIRSPYPITFNPVSVYAGEDLLNDLKSILDAYQPDLIIYPHPDDVHPDHWGLSAFTRLALAIIQREKPDYQPDTYAYLVHRPDFPRPKGLKPAEHLLPPAKLFDLDPNWLRYDLTQSEIDQKEKAVSQYRSQLSLLRTLLESFVRSNELLAQPAAKVLPILSEGEPDNPDSWRDMDGRQVPPIVEDPTKDFITRELAPAADLVAVYAARDGNDQLFLCAQLDAKPRTNFVYTLRVKAIATDTVVDAVASNRPLQRDWKIARLIGRYVCNQMSMTDLGEPWLIFVGASSQGNGVGILDQVAWQNIEVKPFSTPEPK